LRNKLWSKQFTAVISATLLLAWAFYALMPTLPIYLMEHLKMGQGSIGLIMAAFSITAILARPLAGFILDNHPRFPVLIISLVVSTAAYGFYPLVTGVAAMLILRLIHGAIWGTCSSANATVVADIVPPVRLGEGIGIFALCIPVGMTIGPMFGNEVLSNCGPRVMFLSLLCVSLLAVIIALFARTPPRAITKTRFSVRNLFHRKALPLSLTMFFIMIAYGAIIVFVGVYAGQKRFANVTAFFLCFSTSIFFSRLFLGRLFDRGYFHHLVVAGLTLTAAGLPWLGLAATPFQFLAAGVVSGFGFGILMPTCQAAVNDLVGFDERGAANSTYLVSYDLGTGVGVLLIGFLAEKVPLGTIYACCFFPILLSAGIFTFAALPHYLRHRSGNRGASR
jgi:MFS family permease